ncbi:putative holin-like toxin [Virgibacillus dokdonensis]
MGGLAFISDRKEVVPMTVFEALMIALNFGVLIVAMLSFDQKK